jgi:hypothetical protein
MENYIAYHGTDKVFLSFKANQEKKSNGTNGGIWFSSSPVVAESYTACGSYNKEYYLKALTNGDRLGNSIGNSSILKVKLSFVNPLIFDAKLNKSGNLTNDRENKFTIADLFNLAVKNGNDGVIVKNVDDCGSYVNQENVFSTIYGVIKESQVLC